MNIPNNNCVICNKTNKEVSLSKCPASYTYHRGNEYKQKYPDKNLAIMICFHCSH